MTFKRIPVTDIRCGVNFSPLASLLVENSCISDDNIVVNRTNMDNSLTIYDNNRKLFYFENSENGYQYDNVFYKNGYFTTTQFSANSSFVSYTDGWGPWSIDDSSDYDEEKYGSSIYENIVYEIIKITENTFALSLSCSYKNITEHAKSPGIIIFTKTNNGRLVPICPSEFYANIYQKKLANTDYSNYLSCVSNDSLISTNHYPNIPWNATLTDKTILNPIIVQGIDDFCPECFYTPTTQYKLDPHDDAIIIVDGEKYYYNGFIAVKLDE